MCCCTRCWSGLGSRRRLQWSASIESRSVPHLSTVFARSHEEAFKALGALDKGRQWSAFDVRRDQARAGKPGRFVTTIWNRHSRWDESGRRIPTERAIAKNRTDGTLWYRFERPPVGSTDGKWVAHWDGLNLATAQGIPIVGVLKDVHTSRCSLENVFACGSLREEVDGSAVWLELRPRGQVGCEVRLIDIDQFTRRGAAVSSLGLFHQRFEMAVREALQMSSAKRRERLASAPRLPQQTVVTTTVFVRNQYVAAEVLSRAGGRCEVWSEPAPFLRRVDGSPYLEVHHRKPLAAGGEDVVENAVAVCPNCHRAAHYA
jgi:hypothetical protein